MQAAAKACQDWESFLTEANGQRLLPLAYWTFKRHEIPLPAAVRPVLAAAYLRQKSLAQRQTAAMLEAVKALAAQGIEAIVLKGGILSHLAYPEPGLRPMEDIDLLLAPDSLAAARHTLLSLGYTAPPENTRYDRLSHHLPVACRIDFGETIAIELHREIFTPILNCPGNFSNLERPFASFPIEGYPVAYLGEKRLVWMQYRGLRKLAEPLRKLHLVDLALLAERLPDHWQGEALRTCYPDLWSALLALDRYIPLSPRTRQFLGLPPRQTPNSDLPGEDYCGWPRGSRWLETVWPQRWWAEFFYGLGPHPSRWQIQRNHWSLFASQGSRRLHLGPVSSHAFFARQTAPASPPVRPLPAPPSETLLVTCIYDGLWGTRFGGRLNRGPSYRQSLATIARASALPILCFVPPADISLHEEFFADRQHRITWVPVEITDLPHSSEIQRIKAEYPEDYSSFPWQQRCVEIMWGKFHMLREALHRFPGAQNIFWVDAGLANVNVISTKYTTAEALAADDLHRVDAAFRRELYTRMQEKAGHRILALKSTVPHQPGIPEHYLQRPYQGGDGVVAGLFGGRRDAVETLCQRFEQKCSDILADNKLYFEESILTGLLADDPDLFTTFTFDSWYHEGWSHYSPDVINFSQFFDQMLRTPPPADRLLFPWNH